MKKGNLLLYIFCLITGCIDPVNIKTDKGKERLVVDGLITNEPGPATIKLSKSEPYSSYAGNNSSIVRNATVIISDDKGNSEILTETRPGIYTTTGTGLQGQVGNTYTLYVKTKEGTEYTSTPELLAPVPEISNLYTAVREKKNLNSSNNVETIYVAEVYIDNQDPQEQKNYYLWQWKGIYQVSTQPWDYKEKVRGTYVSRPKACCEVCWISEFTNSINVKDDRLANGREIKRHLITEIPITERTFNSKYHIEVKQTSISETAFDYWSMLKTQVSNVGNIQDPPPASIIGNITNLRNPEEKALGYFGASAVTKKSIFINREDLGLNPGELVFPDDCLVIPSSTTEKPSFW